jgi:hypothetical protein
MLIVQTFHSIHEIDSEFISNLELLLEEETPNFEFLVQRQDEAPATDTFTYFLFFGPTQNAPIGFAKLRLREIPWKNYVPWWRRLMFWNKDYLHWKHVTWLIQDGLEGPCVFDSRFKRSGKEKMISLFKESMERADFVSGEITCLNDIQDYPINWPSCFVSQKKLFILGPFLRNAKTYQDYLDRVSPEISKEIKSSWKNLHKNLNVQLGDYPTLEDNLIDLPLDKDLLKKWTKAGAQVLTFEKDHAILGCLLMIKGKNGNLFFEPFVFESTEEPLITEELYIQYALLKFFEFPEARKCHLLRESSKIIFDHQEDAAHFEAQGFILKEVRQTFSSRLKRLELPV